jgi:hypothetical protein
MQLHLLAWKVLASLLILKYFMAFNTFYVMLGMEDLDFSSISLMFTWIPCPESL